MTLEDYHKALSEFLFSMTKDEALSLGICISCKQNPRFYSDAGRKEYQISALCEYCFDEITGKDRFIEEEGGGR